MKILNVIIITGVMLALQLVSQQCRAEVIEGDQKEIIEKAGEILAGRHCPCQCGKYLPGSPKSPSCFGCSAGKAEITYVLECLKNKKTPREIILDLNSPIIIDVFSDYTNQKISKIWRMAKDVSTGLHQFRVVLRAPGLTVEARRAIKLTESARFSGKFNEVQNALIYHNGPWDWNTLMQLGKQNGLPEDEIKEHIDKIDIEPQIVKDRQHAGERGIKGFPSITINRKIVQLNDQAVRSAIEKIIMDLSI